MERLIETVKLAIKVTNGCLLWFLLLVSACSTLKPVNLPPEYTPPPAVSPLWDRVGTTISGNWHVLLNYGPTALVWRLRAIDSATESIDLQTFLWNFDTVGSLMLSRLLSAADRGVNVRILIDDSFLVGEDRLFLALAQHPNIEYRVYNPFKRRSDGLVTRQLLNLAEFSRLDHRMHNKAMIVDNRIAIVGGRNLADEYFGLDEEANFRDLELLIGGLVVEEVSDAFDNYWNDHWSFPIGQIVQQRALPELLEEVSHIGDKHLHFYEHESLQEMTVKWLQLIASADRGDAILYVDTPPRDNPNKQEEAPVQVANEINKLFENAVEEILIISAYLIPTVHLEDTVKQAVARGVRVRVLTNSLRSNNHVAAHSAYRNHINTLLDYGAELHETRIDARDRSRYMLTPIDHKFLALHAKAMVIDNDKVFIGSANLDPRSLRINTEMGFLVISETFNEEVREAVENDFSGANAWQLELQENGLINWVADDQTLTSQPAMSFMQRLEDWFISHLPIEGEL